MLVVFHSATLHQVVSETQPSCILRQVLQFLATLLHQHFLQKHDFHLDSLTSAGVVLSQVEQGKCHLHERGKEVEVMV